MSTSTDSDLVAFVTKLDTSLQPFFKVVKQKFHVSVVPNTNGGWNPPWRFVTVMLDADTFEPTTAFIAKLMRVAAESCTKP